MSKTHEIKCYPDYFRALAIGTKTFEIRKNDRDYQIGDYLIIKEYNAINGYSGAELKFVITYIINGFYTNENEQILKEGCVVMSIKEVLK